MANRRRLTPDELLSILRNIPDDVSDCEDSGSAFDDLHTHDLVSDCSSCDKSEEDFPRNFNSALVHLIILLNDLGLKINLKQS